MSCYQEHPLKRDGTSQDARVAGMLDPAKVPVEGRSHADLMVFVHELSKLIQYYNDKNLRDGSWENLIGKVFDEQKPHEALLATFLVLLDALKEDLNALTGRHLDHYYKEVLKMEMQEATSDKIDLLIELAKDVNSALIPANTYFKAGKDSEGNPVFYKTEQEFSVNKAQIAALKTVYVEKESEQIQQVYAAPVANSADGQGAEIEGDQPKWNTFGESQLGKSADERTMPLGTVGFALSSPVLFLAQGVRTVNIKLNFNEPHGLDASDILEAFRVYFSGEEGWIDAGVPYRGIEMNFIVLTSRLEPSADPVVAFNDELLEGDFPSNYPVVKVVLQEEKFANIFAKFSSLTLASISLTSTVEDMQNLTLQNQQGSLDPASPFMPFGPTPAIGSNFFIGNHEVFQKKLTELKLKVKWFNVPADLNTHYNHYSGKTHAQNERFKVNFSLLKDGVWQTASSLKKIFDNEDATLEKEINLSTYIDGFSRNPEIEENSSYNVSAKNGFLKATLCKPNGTKFKAFGHKEYRL